MSSPPDIPGFIVAERLGSGSYASVYRAVSTAPGPSGVRETVAIKCIDFQRTNHSATAKDNLVREISILKKMRHRHIVQLRDFRWDRSWVYLITDYCAGGDLSAFIRTSRALPEPIARKFLRQLAQAIGYLRSHGIAHMDLKPQNILLSSRHNPFLKLADFGFAQHLREDLSTETAFKGSPLYMAPEILHRRRYDARVDLWSIGVILYECLFGAPPFSAPSVEELIHLIKATTTLNVPTTHLVRSGGREVEREISKDCQNLMHCLLRPDPRDRITFDDFFSHPFVDLSHAPSEDAWARSQSLAAQAQREAEPDAKVKLLVAAVEHGMAGLEQTENEKERSVMRATIRSLLREAEATRDCLRSSITSPEPPPRRRKRQTQAPNAREDSDDVPSGSDGSPGRVDLPGLFPEVKEVKAMSLVAGAAEKAACEERWSDALAKWEMAIEAGIALLKRLPENRRRDVLSAEVAVWLKFAEDVKKYMEITGLGLSQVAEMTEAAVAEEENPSASNTSGNSSNCRLM